MKKIISKVDYELYKDEFLNGKGSEELWSQIKNDRFFLNGAIKLVEHDGIKCFVAPMIVVSMLKNIQDLPQDILDKLINTIISNRDLVDGLWINDSIIDYLGLVLKDDSIKLDSFKKKLILNRVLNSYGPLQTKKVVSYDTLVDTFKEEVASYKSKGLEVTIDKSEAMFFKDGSNLIVSKKDVLNDIKDYREEILENGNFTYLEKDMVLNHLKKTYIECQMYITLYMNKLDSKNSR